MQILESLVGLTHSNDLRTWKHFYKSFANRAPITPVKDIVLTSYNNQIHLMTAEVSQRNGQLNMATAKWQINLTQASIRDAQTMKGLSFMGALFLPGTFLSTIFSMPFFEFNIGKALFCSMMLVMTMDWSNMDNPEKLCIYFAAAIPLTALVIAAWVVWEQIQQRRMTDEQHGMEREIQKLENDAEGASRINHSISFTMKRAQQI